MFLKIDPRCFGPGDFYVDGPCFQNIFPFPMTMPKVIFLTLIKEAKLGTYKKYLSCKLGEMKLPNTKW